MILNGLSADSKNLHKKKQILKRYKRYFKLGAHISVSNQRLKRREKEVSMRRETNL